jgi:hypothetical protein
MLLQRTVGSRKVVNQQQSLKTMYRRLGFIFHHLQISTQSPELGVKQGPLTSKILFLSRLWSLDAILSPSLSSANAVPIQMSASSKSGGRRLYRSEG